MVLSRNVASDSGIIVMAENTMLNDRSIMKLKVYDIDYVFIKSSSEDTIGYEESIEPPVMAKAVSVKDSDDFKKFEKTYEKKREEVKEMLVSIGNGNGVNINALYAITKSIMDSLRSKSDIFAYLGHLRKTDDQTYAHSMNVSLLCYLFGYWLGYLPDEIVNLTTAGMLHDIGKTAVDLGILTKPGRLTKEEYEEVKNHTIYGYRILENQDISDDIKKAALQHHEKINGTGYPTGASGNSINHFARIVEITDIYDAMTNERSYRDKICPFSVLRTFETESYGELDTEYLLLFLQNIAYTYVGSWVTLSNGDVGEVVFINSNHLSTPIVRVDNTFYDLTLKSDLSITGLF